MRGRCGDLIERHESLSTVFPDRLGVPRQEILSVEAAAACGSRSDGGRGRLRGLTRGAGQGFDLSRELPLRAHLFALGGQNPTSTFW